MVQEMSMQQYAERLEVKKQAIQYRMRENLLLPGVTEKKKIGNGWVFLVDLSIPATEAKKYFRKKNKNIL